MVVATSVLIAEVLQGHIPGTVFGFLVVAGVATFVLRGSKIAWSFGLGAPAVRLAVGFSAPQAWWIVVVELLGVCLLAAPPTIEFIWGHGWLQFRGRQKASIQSRPSEISSKQEAEKRLALDPHAYSDRDRPAGWYIDPTSPDHMKYWNHDIGWNGKTRTPEKLLRQWHRESESGVRQ